MDFDITMACDAFCISSEGPWTPDAGHCDCRPRCQPHQHLRVQWRSHAEIHGQPDVLGASRVPRHVLLLHDPLPHLRLHPGHPLQALQGQTFRPGVLPLGPLALQHRHVARGVYGGHQIHQNLQEYVGPEAKYQTHCLRRCHLGSGFDRTLWFTFRSTTFLGE